MARRPTQLRNLLIKPSRSLATRPFSVVMTDYSNWSREKLIERLHQLEGHVGPNLSNGEPETNSPQSSTKKRKQMDFGKFSTRRIALRFAGLAVQNSSQIETVEGRILAALDRARLIPSVDPNDCELSRCGRTDKGVSALRQVISLKVRSLLSPEEQQNACNDEKELDYLHIINRLLPEDIAVYEIALRLPDGFDARFSCTFRRYRYFFEVDDNLNVARMQEAAKLLEGEHDFRNFCKIDGSKQITNFRRRIISSEIVKKCESTYFLELTGTGFLWHQVRMIMAILFSVGQNHEDLGIIHDLLDVSKTPRKPVYEMAADFPLVLWDCGFEQVEWLGFRKECSAKGLDSRLYDMWYESKTKHGIIEAYKDVIAQSTGKRPHDATIAPAHHIIVGNGRGKTIKSYTPLSQRHTSDSAEEINRTWLLKRDSRNQH